MTSELMSLTWVTTLTALMWIPYILNMIAVRGLKDAIGYPENPAPLAPWAQKMKAAHYNAVENLVVFAALVLSGAVVPVPVLARGPAFAGRVEARLGLGELVEHRLRFVMAAAVKVRSRNHLFELGEARLQFFDRFR